MSEPVKRYERNKAAGGAIGGGGVKELATFDPVAGAFVDLYERGKITWTEALEEMVMALILDKDRVTGGIMAKLSETERLLREERAASKET